MVGGFVSVYVGVTWTFLPGALHWIVALLMGALGGMVWGMLVGLFKAFLNVHEVITSIMFNYIALYTINYLVKNSHLFDALKNQTVNVATNAFSAVVYQPLKQQNLALKKYFKQEMQQKGFIRFDKVRAYAKKLIEQYDIRSGQGADTPVRSMSGGNQQKAIIAREIDIDPEVLIAVQPTRGLDVGAMLYIHEQLIKVRDEGKAVLLISLELDEVFQLADRILVIFEGKLVADLDARSATAQQLGLYMAGSQKEEVQHAEA